MSPRVRLAGVVLLLLVVAVLVGSLVAGIGRDGKPLVPVGGAPRADVPLAEPAPGRVRVEVLNAAGVPGLAREIKTLLRDRGFDVVSFGNARGVAGDTSRVIDRVGNPDAARQVADALGVSRVVTERDSTLMVDASVVLGKDWRRPATDASSVP